MIDSPVPTARPEPPNAPRPSNIFNTVQALLGVTWAIWMGLFTVRALEIGTDPKVAVPAVVSITNSTELARNIYVGAFALSFFALGYCFLRLEHATLGVLERPEAKPALSAVLWSLLACLTAVALPMGSTVLYSTGNAQEAALPSIVVAVWSVLAFVNLARQLPDNPPKGSAQT